MRELFAKIVNSFNPLIIYDRAFCKNKQLNFFVEKMINRFIDV